MNDMSLQQLRQLTRPCDYGDPHKDLASSIVVHALGDWQEYAGATDNEIRDGEYHYLLEAFGFDSPCQELLKFLRGDWCCFLVEALNKPHDVFLQEIGLEREESTIVFLDIDGVLASCRNEYKPQCIASLNRITDSLDAVIVVSSSRRIDGLYSMQASLREWGVTGRIVDITPNLSCQTQGGLYVTGNRGNEIRAWLGENKCAGFVILDDEDVNGFVSELVQTDYGVGLTEEDAGLAMGILREAAQERIND